MDERPTTNIPKRPYTPENDSIIEKVHGPGVISSSATYYLCDLRLSLNSLSLRTPSEKRRIISFLCTSQDWHEHEEKQWAQNSTAKYFVVVGYLVICEAYPVNALSFYYHYIPGP